MNASLGSPPRPHWSSAELADAVPRRLSGLSHFDVHPDAPFAESANGEPHRALQLSHHYVPDSVLPGMFRAH